MTLWLLIALLTGLGVLSVLVPLAQRPRTGEARPEELVYRDQLEQIERDRGGGLIAAPELAAARTEIARRLLQASSARDTPAPSAAEPGRKRLASVLALVGIPAIALSVYLGLGSPGLPGQPLAARVAAAPEGQDLGTLVAQVERHLAASPEDGRGWEVLAPIYFELGRPGDAVRAYEAAIRLLGETAARVAGLGEARVREANGVVTEAARTAFQRALALAPGAAKPRFYLALARAQDGDLGGAAGDWRALLAEAPAEGAGALWRNVLADRIAWAERGLGGSAPASAAAAQPAPAGPGPSAEDIRAADAMEPEARREFIQGMVARLAARLEGGDKDLDGWLRLARAYAVLGERAKADAALVQARTLFAGDAAALARLNAAGEGLGGGVVSR